MTSSVDIIGAGIGGLTTALTLQRNGLKVNIFESSKEIKPVGAGIIIANNAMQFFQKLGIQEKIANSGNRISYLKITDKNLKNISVVNLGIYERRYGVSNIAIHRGELQKILATEVGYGNIQLSKKLCHVNGKDSFKLTFEDKSITESKILIGADGINSVVRNQLFKGSELRDAKQMCWRGICEMDLPSNYHHELNEAWGKGRRFGFVKISDKKVYWYALKNSDHKTEHSLKDLENIYSEFHPDILKIISATPKEQIISSPIFDLKPITKWQCDNVCLVGDAAHATTPNLGQGACQAVEDAYVLGKLLDKNIPIEQTFVEYEKLRRTKANTIVNTSWKLGKLAHIENSFGVYLRNWIMANIPEFINRKQTNMIFNLD